MIIDLFITVFYTELQYKFPLLALIMGFLLIFITKKHKKPTHPNILVSIIGYVLLITGFILYILGYFVLVSKKYSLGILPVLNFLIWLIFIVQTCYIIYFSIIKKRK